MSYEFVTFKGMGDGVRIILDSKADLYDILDELERKIGLSKAFFGDGDCSVKFDGRNFTLNEKRKLKELICRLLPLCTVTFSSAEQKKTDTWLDDYKGIKEPEEAEKHIRPAEHEEFLSEFRSDRSRLYQGVVRDGMTIRSDEHLVLLGMVEKGGRLKAVGNILVVGGLYGEAHAGCNGHNGSYILAMDMKPEKLAISGISEEYFYEAEETSEAEVHGEHKKSFFEKFKKRDENIADAPERTEYSAVALLKNNKIELDNFTIKTFTNSKNMV